MANEKAYRDFVYRVFMSDMVKHAISASVVISRNGTVKNRTIDYMIRLVF